MSNARVHRPTGVIDVMVHNRICLSGPRRGAIVRQSTAAKSLPSVTPSHISDKALQQKAFQALQQKSLPSIAAKSLPSNPRAKRLPIHTNTMQSNLIHSNQIKSEVGSENGSEAGVPNRESKPSAHAPAPHARHDRSMARSVLVARQILENSVQLWPPPRPTSIGANDVVSGHYVLFSY